MSIDETDRFYLDLEFVQLLCNAKYLQYLAQNNYFTNDQFMNYIRYLSYWKDPNYAQYIHFPQCLGILDMIIEQKSFRDSLKFPQFVEYLHQQQGSHWMIGPKLVDYDELTKKYTESFKS